MTEEIINPFKQRTNWAKKAERKIENESKIETKPKIKEIKSNKSKKIQRVAKSFKIYPGKISRTFDKRVNKMQVHFDDLDKPKEFVDSGKYLMFLMQFAEKFGLYELYREVGDNGELGIKMENVKKFFEKK